MRTGIMTLMLLLAMPVHAAEQSSAKGSDDSVGKSVAEAARAVGHATREVARDVGHATRGQRFDQRQRWRELRAALELLARVSLHAGSTLARSVFFAEVFAVHAEVVR